MTPAPMTSTSTPSHPDRQQPESPWKTTAKGCMSYTACAAAVAVGACVGCVGFIGVPIEDCFKACYEEGLRSETRW